eukprot:3582545-Pleurochrysis_carterae.AAC.1
MPYVSELKSKYPRSLVRPQRGSESGIQMVGPLRTVRRPTCTRTHEHARVHARTRAGARAYTHAHAHSPAHTRERAYRFLAGTRKHAQTRPHAQICTHIRKHTRAHALSFSRTYTHTLSLSRMYSLTHVRAPYVQTQMLAIKFAHYSA